ncbi:AAA domain, putative AbiEii toxin, Type IV TA system [anaerobic digester metagenome]
MLTKINISQFKCLKNAEIELRPLTILTGGNSSGKSSVLHTILLAARNCNPKNRERMFSLVSKYQDIKFRFILHDNDGSYRCSNSLFPIFKDKNKLVFEDSLYYLTSNRAGVEDIASYSSDYKVGDAGEFLLGTYSKNFLASPKFEFTTQDFINLFDKCPNKQVAYETFKFVYELVQRQNSYKVLQEDIDLINFISEISTKIQQDDYKEIFIKASGKTVSTAFSNLASLLNFWLSYISDSSAILFSERITPDRCKIFFRNNEISEINPFNIGTGLSYLAKVLLLCFLAKPGDTVLIENPELHLHPKAQSRLGEFFSFIASKNIQLIIETHCEHLINSLRYQVYKERISNNDIIIHYKDNENTPFQILRISEKGYYINTEGKKSSFPKGFFDVSIQQLMEIGL